MASKNIAIEVEAYDRLTAHKRSGECFTDVLMRILPPTPTIDEVLKSLAEKPPLSDKAADAILDHVAARRAKAEETSTRKHAS
jgi:predicted CopG family antitoxin